LLLSFGPFEGASHGDDWQARLLRSYFCRESIAVAWDGLDVFLRVEQFSQLRNAVVQIVVFDNGIWPHGLHECVFADEFAGILYQNAKSVEQFAPQTNFLVIA
jgi:hypothetical protein